MQYFNNQLQLCIKTTVRSSNLACYCKLLLILVLMPKIAIKKVSMPTTIASSEMMRTVESKPAGSAGKFIRILRYKYINVDIIIF